MYTRLVTELNDFLRPHYITTHLSNIFEEKLLEFASVETHPNKCFFGPTLDEDKVVFKIFGIQEEDAKKFLNFFKENGDTKASTSFYQPPCNENGSEYWFEVDLNMVYDKLLPRFKEEIFKLKQNNPEKLDIYVNQCADANEIKEYKLLQDISRQLTDIETNCDDAFTKGELHVTFNNLKNAISNHQKHRSHNCGSHEKLVMFCDLFMELCNDNTKLKDNEAIGKLGDMLNTYCDFTTGRQVVFIVNNLRPALPQPRPQPLSSLLGSIFNFFRSEDISENSSSDEESLDSSPEESPFVMPYNHPKFSRK